MLRRIKLNWHIEDSFGKPYRLWHPYPSSLTGGTYGVYILWQRPNYHYKFIYAGKGQIRNRLYSHRMNTQITKHSSLKHPIYVAWAEVPDIAPDPVDGIESYIHKSLKPLEVILSPRANPISVNLPVCFN